MTAETFISSIKTVVHDSGVRGVMKRLQHPSGRRPPQRIVELSQWFSSLPDSDRARVEQLAQLAVHSGIFGMLAVLDGVSAIESGPDKGKLELSYRRGGEEHLLTDERQEYLHDLYQSEVYGQVFGTTA